MKKIRVITVVGTRPEIIRLSRIICKFDHYFEHILIHTGQNYDYELNEMFFDDLQIRNPDYHLGAAGSTSAETIGNVIIKSDEIFRKLKPEALLILGDTNSGLCAISAKRLKIPIFHMEAGNRCFDMRVPEEINRKIIDHTADVNLTYSTLAKDALLREGLPADLIIKIGSPMFEVLNYYQNGINKSNILNRMGLEKRKYFLISVHREENIETPKGINRLREIMNSLCEQYNLPVIVSLHPRTKKKVEGISFCDKIKFCSPMSFKDYNNLQINSLVVLSDSGTISEEASILKFRALNLRETHERAEAMEEATVMMVGLDPLRVFQGLEILIHPKEHSWQEATIVRDYHEKNVSEKVVKIIQSYRSYVLSKTWKKMDQ